MKTEKILIIIIFIGILFSGTLLFLLKNQEKYESFDLICKKEGMNKLTDYRNKGQNCYFLECDNKVGWNIPVKKEYYCNKDKFGDDTIFGCGERYVVAQECITK